QARLGIGWAQLRRGAGATPATASRLTLLDVDRAFERIQGLGGAGSVGERQRLLGELFAGATPEEAGFLVRLVTGELRQGAVAGPLEEALARASGIAAPEIGRAMMLSGDPGAVARAALTEGRPGLARFRLRLFQPLQPMLAQPSQDLEEALGRLGEAALE